MKPNQIKILNNQRIFIKWDNGNENSISLKYLRDECPCANCKGETILLKTYRTAKVNNLNTEMYLIQNIEPIGNYAIQISWRDGHNTGIYSWEYLLKLESDEKHNLTQNYDTLI
jgi:DUF971 family protein